MIMSEKLCVLQGVLSTNSKNLGFLFLFVGPDSVQIFKKHFFIKKKRLSLHICKHHSVVKVPRSAVGFVSEMAPPPPPPPQLSTHGFFFLSFFLKDSWIKFG